MIAHILPIGQTQDLRQRPPLYDSVCSYSHWARDLLSGLESRRDMSVISLHFLPYRTPSHTLFEQSKLQKHCFQSAINSILHQWTAVLGSNGKGNGEGENTQAGFNEVFNQQLLKVESHDLQILHAASHCAQQPSWLLLCTDLVSTTQGLILPTNDVVPKVLPICRKKHRELEQGFPQQVSLGISQRRDKEQVPTCIRSFSWFRCADSCKARLSQRGRLFWSSGRPDPLKGASWSHDTY